MVCLMHVLREYKGFFLICVLVGFLIVAVYVITLFWPKYEERFFELGLLGRNKMAEDYYPGNTSNVGVGSNVTWYIYIHNCMWSDQNVSIRVKLLNSTMQAPDDREHEPSPYPVLFELPLSLSIDETLLIPFSWSILEADLQNESVLIKRLEVNNQTVHVDVGAFSDLRFRLVFELWVYDQSLGEYLFGWDSGKGFYSISLYMWFSVTASQSLFV